MYHTPCMEYCFHIWAGTPGCYLELLDKLQKRICRTVGPSFVTFLETLAHHWYVVSLSLFYRYYFGRCSSELAQLVPLRFSWGSSTCYSDRLLDFSVTIPRHYKNFYVSSFFSPTARLWNSLPIKCFPLACLGFFQSLIVCGTCTHCPFWEINSIKNSWNFCHVKWWSLLNALKLERWGVKIHNDALLLDFPALFWLYRTHALIF